MEKSEKRDKECGAESGGGRSARSVMSMSTGEGAGSEAARSRERKSDGAPDNE